MTPNRPRDPTPVILAANMLAGMDPERAVARLEPLPRWQLIVTCVEIARQARIEIARKCEKAQVRQAEVTSLDGKTHLCKTEITSTKNGPDPVRKHHEDRGLTDAGGRL